MQSSMTTQVSSFQKKSKTQVPSILGSKLSVQNAQLLVSTGVPSLDHVIGGGIAVGTIVLIEEDTYSSYSKVLLKYFLSEGVVSGHSLLVASQERSPEKIVAGLPGLAGNDVTTQPSNVTDDKLAIAWRYQSLKTVQSSPSSTAFGHHFDLTTTIPADALAAVDVHYWPDGTEDTPADTNFHDPAFGGLLSRVRSVTESGGFLTSAAAARRNVLRVAVEALGSPLWEAGAGAGLAADLPLFLYSLRGILRSAYAVALVTVPAHLAQDAGLSRRCQHLVDTSLRLESFSGSARATHPLFRDLHGLLHVRKMAAVNCLPVALTTEHADLGFKLRRKKFLIEKLHLPPELQESRQREQDDVVGTAAGGCGAGAASGSLLDF